MPITYQNLNERLRPFLLTKLDKGVLDLLVDADFLRKYNQVSSDLNSRAFINTERYYKKTGTTNAEDADLTNYLLAGDISEVMSFKFLDTSSIEQYYAFINDRIVLKVAPGDGIQMDIYYLMDVEEIVELTDEIHLPDEIVDDFEELVKVKLQVDYGDMNNADYSAALDFYANKAKRRTPIPQLQGGVRGYNFGLSGDQNRYEIVDHQISLDNFTAGADGNYIHVGGND